ncbi:anaerobic ribonucleoside-triphosphate reductase activating protein [Neisseria chenwenguii]|uniref:Anaerobic ribonucleoside-triphosphate reductase activating protein n=1 Tax=Neisseria chenwenguii TaxID=1853278 RepID=A0A220S4C7_9NEIS|nr:anaerobic ribonucleoside-triphosphate reductase activating protein [Neisseria chenwenguii]ASK28272.1 anaerobic ribonucleoside-triphosphate reductase activating protein [Neisseria chenwenguii]ROV57397.1 anaerobic ribonucleoside-triphosphate reductase activating protein [Neisseria chenwenguii]
MNTLRFTTEQIVWQEVPGEVSLAFLFSGCPLRCPGCHSADTWKKGIGQALTVEYLKGRLKRYRGLISCVLFMGGEWLPQELEKMMAAVAEEGLKICLYTGLEGGELASLSNGLTSRITYLKTGRWRAALGGLDSATTNQRFTDLRTGENLNHLFLKNIPIVKAA